VPVTSAMLPEREPVAPPAVSAFVSSTTIPPAAGTAPLPVSPSPTATLATRTHSDPSGHARAVPVSRSLSRMATREALTRFQPRRVVVRGAWRGDELAPATIAGASASAAAPRAGPLSAEDF
jgi:hypothetical protein